MDDDDKDAASVESNIDEIDITRTLEDELFAAIYHSADHVFDSPKSPDANNFGLKDNTDSSKNIHPNSDARLQTDITFPPGIGVIQSHESLGGKESYVRNVLPLNDWKESLSDISQSDKISTSVSQSNKLDNEVVDTYREVISNTDLYNSKENLSALDTHQPDSFHTKTVRRQKRKRENEFVRGYKPKNWWSSDESNSTDCVAHDGGISSLENKCYEKESKDISPAAECKQSETWLTLSEASSCSQTTNSDESASIKPEELCENHQPMTNRIVCMMAHKPPSSTAHKQVGQSLGVSNEDFLLLSDFSCPDSLVGETSQSSTKSQNTEIISCRNDNGPPSISKNFSAVITLDDSEDSVFEIPVPPKPAPPTIDLEDSESPTLFHDETSSTMSPEKLVETYRIALAKSMYDKTKPDADPRIHKKKKSMNQKKTRPSPRTHSPDNPTSDGNNDVTQNPYTSQAIAAQSLIEQDTPTRVFSSNERLSQVISDANSQLSSIYTIDKGADTDNARFMRDSPMSPDQTSENATLEVPVVTEQQRLETASEVPLRKNRLTENATEMSPNTLIINATEVQSPQGSTKAKDRGETKSSKSLESRKRSVVDVEKRSKGPSPKKTKTSNESAVSGSSRVIPSNESGTSEGNPQSKALDDFFQPMTEEMRNYYNKSWGRENFDIDAIRRDMPKDPQYWTLSNEDLLAHQNRRRRYWSHLRCKNCKRQGHRMSECSEERKLPACYMCGVRGHHKLSCPHTMCLGCGTKQVTYTEYCARCRTERCTTCQSIGHSEDICPDLWRRYHHITSEENLKTQQDPALVMKPANQLSCCNCARRGHDSTTCKDYRWSKYLPTPAYVTNYTSGPAPAQNIILENVDSTNRTRKRGVTEEAEGEGFVADGEDTPSKRKRAKKNKTPDKNLEEDGNSETPVQSTDENTSKIKERCKGQENTRSETGEFFIVQSPEFTHQKTKDFCPSEYKLTGEDYAVYSNSDTAMKFLCKLVEEYLAKLDFRHYTNGTYVLIITAAQGLSAALVQTVKDFAHWRDDERNRFMTRVISKKRVRLVKSLTAKLLELEQDLGNPSELYKTITSLKSRLRSMEVKGKTGERPKSNVKRVKVVDQLARSQCRLNMILQKEGESHKYLKMALTVLKKVQGEKVPCKQYLTIVHHYNKVFAAYTPDNLKALVDRYVKDQKKKEINFHNSQNKNARRFNSPRMRGDDGVHKNTAAPAQSLAITVDNQVEIPTATFNNINRPHYITLPDYINPESEYYQTHRSVHLHPQNSGNRYQDGWQENHWAGFARHTLANNPHNFQPDFNRYCDFRSPMPRSKDQNIQRDAEYHFADDISLNNIPSNIPFIDSQWLNSHTLQNPLPNNILFRGKQAGSSQEFYVGINNTLPASEVDSRAQNNCDNKLAEANRVPQTQQEKRDRKQKQKAEREKNNTPPVLRKRAQKNIVKYKKEWERPRIRAAVRNLQKQINDNCLSLKSIIQFENLAKQEMMSNVKKKKSD